MNFLALFMSVTLVILTLILPRRFAVAPLLAAVGLMPLGQELTVGGASFYVFRLLLLTGILRVIVRGELRGLDFNSTDRVFVFWVIATVVIGSLSEPSMALFVNRAGDAFNAVTCYFFVRCVVLDFDDIVANVRMAAMVSVPVAGLMIYEKITAVNLLSIFGGVPELTAVRGGSLRAQGAFRHPILAGAFGATLVPLFLGLLLYRPSHKSLALIGSVSGIAIAIAASSGGALLTVLAGVGGWFLWRWRSSMRKLRWMGVIAVVGLAMVMEAPVWYLLARVSAITGGTGWHRAYLIDMAVVHFHEWWLFGTTYTAHWAYAGLVIEANPNMIDITNHFIMEGVKGGILKLALFIVLIVYSFKTVGRVINWNLGDSRFRYLAWGMGVSLFAHCISFIGANYFDQLIVVWFWLLAMISGLQSSCMLQSNQESRDGNAIYRNRDL